MLGIQLTGNEPIYEQVVKQMEALVAKGILKKDDLLPSVREMACDLAVNPNTIQKVYSIMEERGITYSVPGKGRFVAIDAQALQKRMDANAKEMVAKAILQAKQSGISLETIASLAQTIYKHQEGGNQG